MSHTNEDQLQPWVRGQRIGYLDPVDLDQSNLEEGLGTLMAELRREKRMACDTADQALRNLADHQSRIDELVKGAARYREALGLPPLSDIGLGFSLVKLDAAGHNETTSAGSAQ